MADLKVKIFYILNNSNTRRLSTFTTKHFFDEPLSISLYECLMSICASSPDIICKDHDLSVYTADFHESNLHKNTIVWEGHGLMSWIAEMEDVKIHGKVNNTDKSAADVYINLQSAMRWTKDEYLSALLTRSFENVLSSTETSSNPACNCYSATYDSSLQLTPPSTHKTADYEVKRKTLTSLPSFSSLLRGQETPDVYSDARHTTKKNALAFQLILPADKKSSVSSCNSISIATPSPSPETQYSLENSLCERKKSLQPASNPEAPLYPKASNATARLYHEVEKDDRGAYSLPVEIDSWTVLDLGTVVYDRPAYHNKRYIYPINYTVRKWYRSMIDPKSDTQYTCRILENGREPLFEVVADDCPTVYSGPTPTTVWTYVVRRAFAIRNLEYGHNPVGPDFFGLRKNTIAKMIQDLPNASLCSQYVWQNFELAKFNKPGKSRRRKMIDSFGSINYGLNGNQLSKNVPTQYASRYKKKQKKLSTSPN